MAMREQARSDYECQESDRRHEAARCLLSSGHGIYLEISLKEVDKQVSVVESTMLLVNNVPPLLLSCKLPMGVTMYEDNGGR